MSVMPRALRNRGQLVSHWCQRSAGDWAPSVCAGQSAPGGTRTPTGRLEGGLRHPFAELSRI